MKEIAEAFIQFLAPLTPVWLALPVALLILILVAWPRAKLIWYDLMPFHRAYQREKMELELLKLNYEIAEIRKKNKLPDLKKATFKNVKKPKAAASISTAQVLFFGACGAFFVGALRLIAFARMGIWDFANYKFLVGALIATSVLSVISAIAAYWSEVSTRRNAFLIGLASVALISALTGR